MLKNTHLSYWKIKMQLVLCESNETQNTSKDLCVTICISQWKLNVHLIAYMYTPEK